ncbi:hypothetical protein ACFRNJ_12465 [Streptomyces sp. NPDC056721]|uniref:hypothetical protein n=1 Tax=Streptomyces sp. NPDC056721 TaxID=3345923 RepID=UPI0036A78D71
MFWYCDECAGWGVSETDVDGAVDKQRHLDAHREPVLPAPAAAEEPEEVTVWTLKNAVWGITALLGLLSARFPDLVGVSTLSVLLAFVVTGLADD